ncbi:ATP-binding protein [Nocardioides sp. CFH 31398]|uniref:sensor histidine kinase n=1 Tax=Nocardioides sp. CFH 31398 TaxID=2919579 RepID=UPI001F06C405|nr:ATP-binding protein [Nocardioides sp. CFH 31398]MCH1865969.1 ATP-binding protein [Nocardioides sp. CFH 31398]
MTAPSPVAPPAPGERTAESTRIRPGRARLVGLAVILAGCGGTAAVLLSPLPADLRSSVSGLALLAAGLTVGVSCTFTARRSQGLRKRGWQLIALAALVAITGNLLAQSGMAADERSGVQVVGDLLLALAVALVTTGAICLPQARWRGRDLATVLLDGVLAVAAVLVIASSLVFSDILSASPESGVARATTLLIPVLDVLLGTVATVLFLGARSVDRAVMALIAAGSVSYVLSDLHYAVVFARGGYAFGSGADLGWILGYGLLATAAILAPDASDDRQVPLMSASHEVRDTAVVYVALLSAGVVQVLVPVPAEVRNGQALLWLVLIIAASSRQILLGWENAALRRGLQRQVANQTTDLRRMVRQTNVLLDSVGDGIYGVDQDGRVTFMNPSGLRLLGLDDLEHSSGEHAHDAFHAPRPDGTPYPRSGCYVTEAIEQGVLTVAEDDEYLRADGSHLAVEITASPMVDETTGEVGGAVVVFRDATARREMEKIKEEFLSVVSHELRTPLTSIRGSLGLLSGGALGLLPERAATVAKLAEDSSQRLARLINDMLDMERLTSGTVVLQSEDQACSDLLTVVEAELSGLSRVHDVELVVDRADGVAFVDRDRFVQVMTNLVGNAMKFSARGQQVHVSTSESGGEILVMVRDEGRGIPADQLERIFDRFHQVDSSDSRLQGGTGLGLAISRGLIEQMDGRVWAESTVGVGTTFWFTLPVGATARRVAEVDLEA